MNIFAWVGAHTAELLGLIGAILCISTANKIVTKTRDKERGGHALWTAFVFYAFGGLALARMMIPTIHWLIGKGSGAGIGAAIGGITTIVTFALGWQAIAMLVSMIRDLFDKQPNREARTAALWVPTFLPIGGTAVVGLLQNPQGLGQGITAAAMGLITLIYAFMIVRRADAAQTQNHKKLWNWFAFGVLVLAGIVIIPLIAYTDTALIAKLPGGVRNIVRAGIGLAGAGALVAGFFDIWVDRVPDKFARTAAIFGIGAVTVFGAIGIAALTGAASDGASVLNGVF